MTQEQNIKKQALKYETDSEFAEYISKQKMGYKNEELIQQS